MVSERTKFILYATFSSVAFLFIVIVLVNSVSDEISSGVMHAKKYSCSRNSEFWCYSFGILVKTLFIPFFGISACGLLISLINGKHHPKNGSILQSKTLIDRYWFFGPIIATLLLFSFLL